MAPTCRGALSGVPGSRRFPPEPRPPPAPLVTERDCVALRSRAAAPPAPEGARAPSRPMGTPCRGRSRARAELFREAVGADLSLLPHSPPLSLSLGLSRNRHHHSFVAPRPSVAARATSAQSAQLTGLVFQPFNEVRRVSRARTQPPQARAPRTRPPSLTPTTPPPPPPPPPPPSSPPPLLPLPLRRHRSRPSSRPSPTPTPRPSPSRAATSSPTSRRPSTSRSSERVFLPAVAAATSSARGPALCFFLAHDPRVFLLRNNNPKTPPPPPQNPPRPLTNLHPHSIEYTVS